MDVVILCGGKGTRLNEETIKFISKIKLEFPDIPIISGLSFRNEENLNISKHLH